MLTSLHLHKKSSEVSIKTRSTPASLSIQGQDTKHTTVKWPIADSKCPRDPLLPLEKQIPIVKQSINGHKVLK